MSSGMPLLAIVALPFIGSLVAAFLRQDARNGAAVLAGAVALCGTALTAIQYPVVHRGGVLRIGIEWLPTLGLDFTLRERLYVALGVLKMSIADASAKGKSAKGKTR